MVFGEKIFKDKNIESLKLIKKSNLNLNQFDSIDGHSADIIARANKNAILILKIESCIITDKASIFKINGLKITRAEIFNEEIFESILAGFW